MNARILANVRRHLENASNELNETSWSDVYVMREALRAIDDALDAAHQAVDTATEKAQFLDSEDK